MISWLDQLSIRSRIVLMVLAPLFFVAILVAWITTVDVRMARDAARDKLEILASQTAADLQRVLNQYESVMARVAMQPMTLGPADASRCEPIAQYLLFGPGALAYQLRDERGRVICGSEPVFPAIAVKPATIETALAANGFRISNLIVDDQTGRRFVLLSYPTHDVRGSTAGLLVLAVDLLALGERLLKASPDDAVVTVFDGNRTIVMRSIAPEALIGTQFETGQAEANSAQGERKDSEADAQDRESRFFAFVTLNGAGWQVVASLPRADVFAKYKIMILRAIGVVQVLCLLAFVLAWRLSSAIARPIAQLKETAGQIAAGRYAIRASVVGPPEIRAVARQLNQMLDARALSEARLRGVFETAVDAILTADEDLVILQANPAASRMFRCSLDDLIGAHLGRFIPSLLREGNSDDVLDRQPTGLREMGVKWEAALRSNAEEFPVEASTSHLSIDGRPLYTVILRDITERKQAEEKLRAGASKLHAALSSMTDAVCISDSHGRFVEINDAFATFHGFADKSESPEALQDYQRVLDVRMANGSPLPLAQWPLARALRGETASNVEYLLRRRDLRRTWVGSFSFAPICSETGAITGAVTAARDVTTLRQVQVDLEASHLALQRLIASRDQVQEEERKRIARELHDDLQQTLAAMRMELQVILGRFAFDAPELAQAIARVDRLGEQAFVSTRQIVNALRPPMLEDLGLLPAVEALASHFTHQTGIACAIDADDELSGEWMLAPAAAICLYRVTQEALNNVAKHSHASQVRIRLAKESRNSISLHVADDGRGMAAAAKPRPDSFGILGIRERVRANGGFVKIEGTPGAGTVVNVRLPVQFEGEAQGLAEPSAPDSKIGEMDEANTLPRLLSQAADKTLQGVIDAVSGMVAIVDRHGLVRFVNRAWTDFAERNGGAALALTGPGANYLEACRRSAREDESALRVLRGLEDVIQARRDSFSCEYPCHSPIEARWFQLHVTPMASGDLMVSHFLIRVRRRNHEHSTAGVSRAGLTAGRATPTDSGRTGRRTSG